MMGFVSDEASRQHDVVDGGLIAAGGYSAAPGRAMQRFFSQHPWTLTALILIGGALLYAQTISFGLVAVDDPWLLGSNTLLQTPSLASLHHVLFDLSAPTRYRLGAEYLPVRDLSVMLDFAIFGHHYGAHHASQVFLYLVSGLALIMALRRWLASPHLAVLTAALWIAHPLHVESVAWLADRKGILAALFSFGALIAFHRFATRGSLRWWFFTTLALVAALWSKGTAIATPALLGAFLWFNPRADTTAIPRRRAWIGLFATLPVVGVAFIPVWIAGSRLAMISAQHGGNTFTAGAMMMEVHARYLFRAFLGGPLGIAYDTPPGIAGRPFLFALGLVAFVVVLGSLLWIVWRHRPRVHPSHADAATSPDHAATATPLLPIIGLAVATWVLYLLPVSQVFVPLQNAMADRYLLLPSLGVCLLAGALALRVPRQSLRMLLIGTLLVAEIALTLAQTRTWANNRTLFSQAIIAHPTHLPSLLQLARLADRRGDNANALRWLKHAKQTHPNDPRVAIRLAFMALRHGDTTTAIALFRQAAKAPREDRARANLALLLSRRGAFSEALDLARRAVHIRPLKAHNHYALGLVALRAGKLKVAQEALNRARALRPDDGKVQRALARLAQLLGAKFKP